MTDTYWVDGHCHLPDGAAAAEVVAEAVAAGVVTMITVGTDRASSVQAIEHASRHPEVFATVGVHPHDAKDGLDGIEDLLAHERVVAVGECGLDYHYDHSPRDVQRAAFEAQIELAHRHELALVIHTREAWPDTFAILEAAGVPDRTVFHCFTGGPAEAEAALELGAHVSVSGIVTFPSAGDLREAVALCPLDRLVVETDSPYLTPVPHRGTRNRPALVPLVGEKVAEVLGRSIQEVAEGTSATAARLYGLDFAVHRQ